MPRGYLDTSYIDFPPGVDVGYINGLQTRAGISFTELLQRLDARMSALNTTVDPLVASLITTTTEQYADQTGPVAFEVERKSEYTVARPQFAEGQAHMIPIHGYDVSLGLTEDGLDSMSEGRIMSNVDSVLSGYKRLYRKEALTRLFSDAEIRVDHKTVVTSPGMAGSGTGDNVFTRSYRNGGALPAGYTHYYRVAAAGLAAGIIAARDRLKKWHSGPFDLVGSVDQITAISALPQFVSAGSELIRVGSGTAEAQVDASTYAGVFDRDIRVHMAVDDFTDPNVAVYKSYGNFDPQNPLTWRYDELKGRDAYIRYRSLTPLDQAVVLQKFGIGVGNRVGATLIRVDAAGGYVAPVIA